MTRKGKSQESCVFEYDHIEQWGPELKRLFANALPKRLKRIFEAEPPDDTEHAREILLAHMDISRSEAAARLTEWLKSKRIATYYGAWLTDAEYEQRAAEPSGPLSLSRAPFEQCFDAYVPWNGHSGRIRRIIRIEAEGEEVLRGTRGVLDGLPDVIRDVLDAWAYWLADSEFSPADEITLVLVSSPHRIER
jgi:hypothetical protein